MTTDKNIKLFESMLFDNETITRTDFCNGQIPPLVKTKLKKRPTCYRLRPPPIKDIHTLNDWKTSNVPFELFIKRNEVVTTNPWHVQQPYEEPPDLLLEEVRRTRPRLVMSPAISLDDIEDPWTREALLKDVYTTTVQRALRESASGFPCNSVIAPLPDHPAPPNPMKLPAMHVPYVSPEWRMDSVSWDNKQMRGFCVPTKEFWLRKPTQPNQVGSHKKIRR